MLSLIKNLIPQRLRNWYHLFIANLALIRFHHPSNQLTVIAVTGTDGKTTTATLIYHLLKHNHFKVALISTVAAYIGDQEIDTGFHVTSPDPWQLQQLLHSIKQQGYDHVVLEITSHGLDQHRVHGINPTISALTNITPEHLDYHHTYDCYLRTKAKLFARSQTSILNQDDQSFNQVKQLVKSKTSIIAYHSNLLRGNLLQAIKSRFPEPYNQSNATAAVLVANHLSLKDKHLLSPIKSFPGVPGRMQSVPNKRHLKLIVDFAHTPNALKNALTSLRSQTKGQLIAVYGSAGLRDRQKRPQMAKIGSELADEVILTAEDPRTEPIWTILDQMRAGITTNRGHCHFIPDRQQAINFALRLAKPGDTVAVLGKGHEKSMCFGKIEHPWSDAEAVQKALAIKTKK